VAEALGREFAEFFHPDDLEGYRTKARAALAGGAAHLREELRFVEKDGRERWAEVHVRLIRGADGRVVGSTGVLTDITDAVRFKAEREARERTEEMLRLKSAFLNNMSHEIRTPLTAIIGFAEVLADEVGAEHREHVAIIDAAARRLHGTLDAVLALAQIESGSVPLDVEALDAYDEAEAALARSRPAAERKGLTLTLTGGPSFVVADRPALRRVLGHLIGNAVKFTERGGVTVEVGGGEGAGWIRVSDTGAGIPAAFLPRLFGEFTQGSEGYGRSHEGSGLGLAVAKRLLGLMGGALDVASEAGRGATFTVRLPAVAPTAAA